MLEIVFLLPTGHLTWTIPDSPLTQTELPQTDISGSYFSPLPIHTVQDFSDSSTSFNTCSSLLHTPPHNRSFSGAHRPLLPFWPALSPLLVQ